MVEQWMQEAFKNAGKGVFHRQLGIPKGTKIPVTLLRALVGTMNNKHCHNPTLIGNHVIKVTPLIKHRANALLNADVVNKKRR